MATVGFLGLGAMGTRMATRLLAAGHTVQVYNRTPERAAPLVRQGALAAATPRAAAQGAAFVVSMVRDDEASRAVWLDEAAGALAALGPGTVAAESSTLTGAWVGTLAEHVRRTGAAFVDAPVVGSRPQAEAGGLIFLVGGEAGAVGRLEPLLDTMGGAVHYVGPVGAGTTLKLAVNALFGVQLAALGELLSFMTRAGLEPERALEVLAATPVLSPAAKGAGALMVSGQDAPLFPIDLAEKDFGYVVGSAEALGGSTPVARAAWDVYGRAQQRGLGGRNISAVAKLFDSAGRSHEGDARTEWGNAGYG